MKEAEEVPVGNEPLHLPGSRRRKREGTTRRIKAGSSQRFPNSDVEKASEGLLGSDRILSEVYPAAYADIAATLTDLTKKDAPNRVHWTSRCKCAFLALKEALCSKPILKSPDFGREFILQTDASNCGIGAILSQRDEYGHEHLVAFFSRKLLPRETRYSTIEKECLAIKLATHAFRVYLLGRKFVVQTDHRALEWLHRLKGNAQLARWSLALQPDDFRVCYRTGKSNGNADVLSRAFAADNTTLSPEKEGGM